MTVASNSIARKKKKKTFIMEINVLKIRATAYL